MPNNHVTLLSLLLFEAQNKTFINYFIDLKVLEILISTNVSTCYNAHKVQHRLIIFLKCFNCFLIGWVNMLGMLIVVGVGYFTSLVVCACVLCCRRTHAIVPCTLWLPGDRHDTRYSMQPMKLEHSVKIYALMLKCIGLRCMSCLFLKCL